MAQTLETCLWGVPNTRAYKSQSSRCKLSIKCALHFLFFILGKGPPGTLGQWCSVLTGTLQSLDSGGRRRLKKIQMPRPHS